MRRGLSKPVSWPRRMLCSRKSRWSRGVHSTVSLSTRPKRNNNAPFQVDFLKSEVADLFWKSREKRGSFDARPRAVVCASRGRGDTEGCEGLRGIYVSCATWASLPTNIRQRHSGTAAREQFADRHKTVARLPTVAGLASN